MTDSRSSWHLLSVSVTLHRRINTQMNQSWHSLMTHCHLCSMSHFIRAVFQKHTHSICPYPEVHGTFDRIMVKIQTKSHILTPVSTVSYSFKSGSLCAKSLSESCSMLVMKPLTGSHFLPRLCPFTSSWRRAPEWVGEVLLTCARTRVVECHHFSGGHPVLLVSSTHLVATSSPLRAISVHAPLPS